MKAVIFAGGLGTRMREETDFKPKPMVEIGAQPVLWHLMKIFSHYGVRDFVILAGYKSEVIKNYFANFNLYTRDFRVSSGSESEIEFLGGSSENWNVTVLDTGRETLTGERLLRAKDVIGNERFFCTYGDGLAPVDLDQLVNRHMQSNRIATMTVTQPTNRFGVVDFNRDLQVSGFKEKPKMADWINMGFFVFEPEVFSYLSAGEALEESALARLAQSGEIGVNPFEGFWEPMDTYREYQMLNQLWSQGNAPWKIWES